MIENRPVAPLKPADDAILIDSTSMSIDAVFNQVLQLVNQRFIRLSNWLGWLFHRMG